VLGRTPAALQTAGSDVTSSNAEDSGDAQVRARADQQG
jgi:hypothetical protein